MKLRTLGMLVVAVVVLAACGTEGGDTTTTTGTPDETTTTADAAQEETTTTAAAEETTTTGAAAAEGVHVAESDLGQILVNPEGFTLYVFTQDTGGESVCYDACAETWPPVPADTPIGGDLDAAMFGSSPRTDGTEQLTVNGMPLYLYAPDTAPGDTNGQGANDVWFVVDPSGNMITASAAANVSTDEEETPFDYDY